MEKLETTDLNNPACVYERRFTVLAVVAQVIGIAIEIGGLWISNLGITLCGMFILGCSIAAWLSAAYCISKQPVDEEMGLWNREDEEPLLWADEYEEELR